MRVDYDNITTNKGLYSFRINFASYKEDISCLKIIPILDFDFP